MSTPDIHGIIGYTITPFSADGEHLDLAAYDGSFAAGLRETYAAFLKTRQ